MDNLETLKLSFIQRNKAFFDADLLKMIYWTDKYCICNVVNCEYILFPYNYIRDGIQGGFEFQPEDLPRVIDASESHFFSLFHSLPLRFGNTSSNCSVLLTQRTFAGLQKLKNKYENNPNKNINLDYENMLIKSLEGGGFRK